MGSRGVSALASSPACTGSESDRPGMKPRKVKNAKPSRTQREKGADLHDMGGSRWSRRRAAGVIVTPPSLYTWCGLREITESFAKTQGIVATAQKATIFSPQSHREHREK